MTEKSTSKLYVNFCLEISKSFTLSLCTLYFSVFDILATSYKTLVHDCWFAVMYENR